MEITIRAAQASAQDLEIGNALSVQELRLNGTGITLSAGTGGAVRAEAVNATLIVTEAALNRFLAGKDLGAVHDLEVATLSGRLRVTGRWNPVGALLVPFTAVGVPEIEGGARLAFRWQQINAAHIPLGFLVQVIGEIINARLAEAFDITKLPVPLRLTGIAVEPGRLLLSASATLELRPAETALDNVRVEG